MATESVKLDSYRTVDGRISLYEVTTYKNHKNEEFVSETDEISQSLELRLSGSPINVMPLGFDSYETRKQIIEMFDYHKSLGSLSDEVRTEMERLYETFSDIECLEEGVDISETDEPGYTPLIPHFNLI